MRSIDSQFISSCLNSNDFKNLFRKEDTTVHFVDWHSIKDRLEAVKSSFPADASHTVAIKSNPLTHVLSSINGFGFGLEAASFEETKHAVSVGCSIICWDSPAKTELEIEDIASNHPEVFINSNSLKEATHLSRLKVKNPILLRINPEYAGTAHQSMSVGTKHSKFGEPISNRAQIIENLVNHESIVGLHVHTSSQTQNFEELIESIRDVIDLANEIGSSRKIPLKWINIGGGFPVDYSGTEKFKISDYADLLRSNCPELFDGSYQAITEFGRYYHANTGFTLTQVSEVKSSESKQTIIVHAGADMFLREAYQPGVWPHQMLLLDQEFQIKNDGVMSTDVAGPLCFGGDYLQKTFDFYKARAGDWLVIKDSGANSIALWSKHCSRAFPKCILIENDTLRIIRDRDTLDRNLAFWS
jgi:diaminopimelate decarboxylase